MKRGLYGKIDFWNRLMDVPIGDPDAPLLLTGYEPNVLKGNTEYKPSGLLGEAETYADYKNDLAERREKIRQKMLYLMIKRRLVWTESKALEKRKKES